MTILKRSSLCAGHLYRRRLSLGSIFTPPLASYAGHRGGDGGNRFIEPDLPTWLTVEVGISVRF